MKTLRTEHSAMETGTRTDTSDARCLTDAELNEVSGGGKVEENMAQKDLLRKVQRDLELM
jgi:hypothetical protein